MNAQPPFDRPAGTVTQLEPPAMPVPPGSVPYQHPPGPVFDPFAGNGYGPPPPGYQPPPPPRRRVLMPILVVLLVLSALFAVGGGGAALLASRAEATPVASAWLDLRPAVRDPAITALLDRRAKAVLAKDQAAFMADVDQSDAAFVKREQLLYENLAKIPFSELGYELERLDRRLATFLPANLRGKYRSAVHVAGVTVKYKIEGVDSKTVTTPWLPIVGYVNGRWMIVGQTADKNLPFGANGQPWDAAGPITVVRSARVVAVLSGDDAERGPYLLQLAERGMDQVLSVRPANWDGKVFVTAVQDQRIFDTYFADSPDRVADVAAIAVPYFDRIPDWHGRSVYASTRIVFNPQELSAQPEALAHDLVHEFAHAAMGPVTTGFTPRWLVEGFAEYVSYANQRLPANVVKRMIGDLDVSGGLPSDETFYSQSRNYVGGWLACKLIAERFGQAKLIALYESFIETSNVDIAVRQTLGVERSAFESQWKDYVARQRA